VAEALLCGQPLSGSPSGLLSRRTWEAALARIHGRMPGWYEDRAERDRQFARWVQAEAKDRASGLERMLHPGIDPALSNHVRAVVAALRADADWARHRLDGSLQE
jgi:hypothetical protein